MPIATSQYPASFNLSDLNGFNGFTLNGIINSIGGKLLSAASACDINGDGISDIVIGVPAMGCYQFDSIGQIYVIFGHNSTWNSAMSLSIVNGTNGFILNGIKQQDQTGYSVSSAGDVNGDGIFDILIGAPYANDNAGQSYVVFGHRGLWSVAMNLSMLDGTNGFIVNGMKSGEQKTGDRIAISVASAGDVNDDGISDILIGAPYANNNIGQSYVIFGNRAAWPAQFNLTALNGTNGFIVNGINRGDGSGNSVSSAGDVNGDGVSDILIGAPYVNSALSQSYVIFGHRGLWKTIINLSELNGKNGFVLNGRNAHDGSGSSVASAGDINGDGVSDILIGAPDANNWAGQSCVVFGHRGLWKTIINLSELNGKNGFVLNGINPHDGSGTSVALAGDINSDGLSDILIGAPAAKGGAGQSYVVFGQRGQWDATINLSVFNGTNGFVLNGINQMDGSGYSVATAGDVNGDNIPDILISTPFANHVAGQSYIIFGSVNVSLTSNSFNISNGGLIILNSTYLSIYPPNNKTLFSINTVKHAQFEYIFYPGVKINEFVYSELEDNQIIFSHDGTGEVVPYYSITCSNGLSAVTQIVKINFIPKVVNSSLFFMPNYSFSTLMGTNGLVLHGVELSDNFGNSVSSAGDINNDGISDILIGAPGADYGMGRSYIIFGSKNPWGSAFNMASLNNTDGFVLNGINQRDGSGSSVASIGDVNGDGIDDILIGAPGANFGMGQSYVVFGHRDIWISSLTNLNGYNGFVLNGVNQGDASGASVSSAGDMNDDGIEDLIIGAVGANNAAGQSYVVFGHRGLWNTTIDLFALNGTNGFIINGINSNDRSGSVVTSVNDVNGDSISDLIIGAPYANNMAGQSYVVFGSRNSWSPIFDLNSLNGTNGFSLNGINSNDQSGSSVNSAGDINGDGISDILIGAPDTNNYAGQSYVIFGHHNPWNATINLNSLNGVNGFILNGTNAGDGSGNSVASAGDVNGDGLSDILIGSANANNQAGQSYIIFGHHNLWNATINLSELDGINGFILNGVNVRSYTGTSVASAGDINGDGIPDILIGAPSDDKLCQIGQTYIIFGSYEFLQLAANQLIISNGQSIVVTPNILSVRSFVYLRNLVRFSISNLQHGHFELISNNFCSAAENGKNVTVFTQNEIDTGNIIFVHDGTLNTPSYSVSIATSTGLLPFSAPQPANINFATYLSIENATFIVNQYQQQVTLSNANILAKNALTNDPAKTSFKINALENGWFAKIDQPKSPINSFTQFDINQKQICFYSPCGVNNAEVLPGFSILATAPEGLITAPAIGVVFYNPAPIITKNSLSVNQQQAVVINSDNIAATDLNSSVVNATAWLDPAIQFGVKNITGGYFQLIHDKSQIISFNQSQIINSAIQFVSNSMFSPSYSLVATDTKGAMSLPNSGTVSFKQPGDSSSINLITIATSASVGGMTAAGLGLFFVKKRNRSRLHQSIVDASKQNSTVHKIAEVIFEKIKLTGFLGYIAHDRVAEYIDAIKEVLKELEEINFPVDLATMAEKSRNHFLKEFPRQIKAAFPLSEQSKMQFFKSEITPRQIKSEANHIASNIKYMMDKIEGHILNDDEVEQLPVAKYGSINNYSNNLSDASYSGELEALIKNGTDSELKKSKCFVM